MQQNQVPGIVIQVVGPDGPILQIAKGERDIENHLPVTS